MKKKKQSRPASLILPDDLRFVVWLGDLGQTFGVQRQPLGHLEAPEVLHLAAQVQVQLGHQQAVLVAGQGRRAGTVRGGNVRGAVERAKVLVRRLPVRRGKLVREDFGADAVDRHREVPVGDGRVAGLDAPQGFAEGADLEMGTVIDRLALQKLFFTLTVADGLNTISAPFSPNIIQFCG